MLRTPVTAAERQAIEAEERRRQIMLSVKKGYAANLGKLLEAGIKPDIVYHNFSSPAAVKTELKAAVVEVKQFTTKWVNEILAANPEKQ